MDAGTTHGFMIGYVTVVSYFAIYSTFAWINKIVEFFGKAINQQDAHISSWRVIKPAIFWALLIGYILA